MRKLLALTAVGTAVLLGGQAVAADLPEYPEIDVPDVNYDVGGSFYLRGSAALNLHWAPEVVHPADASEVDEVVDYGYGYSWGAGFGYETGTGLRFDGTLDSVETTGLKITKDNGDPDDGDYTLMLRSTVALANVYYDFGLGDGFGGYSGSGGAFGYVGAGVGVAWDHAEINSPLTAPTPVPTGDNVSAAAAVMAGVGYDMGKWVADVGYRGLYIDEINNSPTDEATTSYYEIHNNWIHEVRGTVRYRFD
jgi:opacity protein-like surface antigen